MTNKKKKYKVYYKTSGTGVYYKGETNFVGETYAVSKKQAVNNVRFRIIGKGHNWNLIGDRCEEGELLCEFIAEEV